MTIHYFGDYKFGEGFQNELSKYFNPYIMGELKRTGKYTGQVKDGTEVLFCISLILSKNTAKITFVKRQGKISKKGLSDAKQVAKILDRNGVDVTIENVDEKNLYDVEIVRNGKKVYEKESKLNESTNWETKFVEKIIFTEEFLKDFIKYTDFYNPRLDPCLYDTLNEYLYECIYECVEINSHNVEYYVNEFINDTLDACFHNINYDVFFEKFRSIIENMIGKQIDEDAPNDFKEEELCGADFFVDMLKNGDTDFFVDAFDKEWDECYGRGNYLGRVDNFECYNVVHNAYVMFKKDVLSCIKNNNDSWSDFVKTGLESALSFNLDYVEDKLDHTVYKLFWERMDYEERESRFNNY